MAGQTDPNAFTLDVRRRRAVQRCLVPWYQVSKRELPWRNTGDPYAVLVSEVMLQQTQVATAIPYFERFMSRFPDAQALAAARIDDVLHLWQGLGYYSRARNLHRTAQEIVERFRGEVPRSVEDLLTLPGIGRYTAGAVASIGYNEPAPLLDGNVMRVLTRLFAIEGNPKSGATNRLLWRLAGELVLADDARTFNVALMELGSLICTPKRPACGSCPLSCLCEARRADTVERFPELPPRRATVSVEHVAVLVERDGAFLLTRRPTGGTWAGLWELPRVTREQLAEQKANEPLEQAARRAASEVGGVEVRVRGLFGTIRHSVTHHRIRLYGFQAEWVRGTAVPLACDAVAWVTWETLSEYALSSPQRRLLEVATATKDEATLFPS